MTDHNHDDYSHEHEHSHNVHEHTHDAHDAHEHTHDARGHDNHAHAHDAHAHDHELARGEVSIEKHEGALVASVRYDVQGNYDEIEHNISIKLSDLSKWVQAQGGDVGHIKSSLRASSATTLSTTGDTVNVTHQPAVNAIIEVAAIVFNVEEAALKARMEELL